MNRNHAQRALDGLAARAVKRANMLPEDSEDRAKADERAARLIALAAEPDEQPGDVLDDAQARDVILAMGWRG